ncbi:MAG: chromate transporter [Clostridia bacterium]|nr:MAG: chromate transporter [Clostridia bacterium]
MAVQLVWRLFGVFFNIGFFTIGGGYAMLPLLEREIVDRRQWLERQEMVDLIATAQSAPGVLAVNLAVLVGYRLDSLKGALASALGAVLPSFFIILLISQFFARFYTNSLAQGFFRGARPAVVALLAFSAFSLARVSFKGFRAWGIGLAAFALLVTLNLHPVLVIVGGAVAGWTLFRRKEDRNRDVAS